MCCLLKRRLWSNLYCGGRNHGVRHYSSGAHLSPETDAPARGVYRAKRVRYEPCVLGGIRHLVDR
jgi:hypothetical protein